MRRFGQVKVPLRKSLSSLIVPADVITLVNAGLGFLSILFLVLPVTVLVDVRVQISFCLILLAMMADGLDGMVARKTRHGELGEYLEAMADMTSLGIAPAVFVGVVYAKSLSSIFFVIGLMLLLLLFVKCSIIRLSSFHIRKHAEYFVGLPASAGTIVIIVLAFVDVPVLFLFLVLLLVSLGMVSPIRFVKPGIKMNAVAFLLLLCAILLRHTFWDVAPLVLCGALLVYVFAGSVYLYKKPE